MALDPNEYFFIVPNMLVNGSSTSPSNTPPPYDKARLPGVAVYANVSVQHKLVTEHFRIERLALGTGWSMGAGQTYQWAVVLPPTYYMGSTGPRTSVDLLETLRSTGSSRFAPGWYSQTNPPPPSISRS